MNTRTTDMNARSARPKSSRRSVGGNLKTKETIFNHFGIYEE